MNSYVQNNSLKSRRLHSATGGGVAIIEIPKSSDRSMTAKLHARMYMYDLLAPSVRAPLIPLSRNQSYVFDRKPNQSAQSKHLEHSRVRGARASNFVLKVIASG